MSKRRTLPESVQRGIVRVAVGFVDWRVRVNARRALRRTKALKQWRAAQKRNEELIEQAVAHGADMAWLKRGA
jgi:hypothetical protein